MEEIAQTGTLELARLLDGVAFGDQNKPVPLKEVAKCVRDVGKKLDLVRCDGFRKGCDAGVGLRCGRSFAELLEAIGE